VEQRPRVEIVIAAILLKARASLHTLPYVYMCIYNCVVIIIFWWCCFEMNDYVLYIGFVIIILVALFWHEYHVLLFVWCCFNM